ncbi:MAG: hypothetical protein ACXVK3_08005 [Candidatus Angelobacter sp.]
MRSLRCYTGADGQSIILFIWYWVSLDRVGETDGSFAHIIPTAVSEHAHSSACEQPGGTLCFAYCTVNTGSLGSYWPAEEDADLLTDLGMTNFDLGPWGLFQTDSRSFVW